jgi:cytochrome c biogenesis protein CcmG/thiol:disulfide interchange protein DsbE
MWREKGLKGVFLRVGLLALSLMILATTPVVAAAATAGKMPDFSEKNVLDQSEIDSASLRGQVVLVNFWATWCPPCRKEIPFLIKMQDKYRDHGFTVLGISMDEGGRKMVGKFLEKLGVNYPVIIGDGSLARGFGGVMGVPASFLVDREGNLVKRYDGYVTEKVLNGEVEKLLN